MTALKVLVVCVSIATLGALVAIPYKLNETAGIICLAGTVIAALAALSGRLGKAMEQVWRRADRFQRPFYVRAVVALLLALPVLLRDVLPELVTWVYLGVLCSLANGWLSYKVVETLRVPRAEPESGLSVSWQAPG